MFALPHSLSLSLFYAESIRVTSVCATNGKSSSQKKRVVFKQKHEVLYKIWNFVSPYDLVYFSCFLQHRDRFVFNHLMRHFRHLLLMVGTGAQHGGAVARNTAVVTVLEQLCAAVVRTTTVQ